MVEFGELVLVIGACLVELTSACRETIQRGLELLWRGDRFQAAVSGAAR